MELGKRLVEELGGGSSLLLLPEALPNVLTCYHIILMCDCNYNY